MKIALVSPNPGFLNELAPVLARNDVHRLVSKHDYASSKLFTLVEQHTPDVMVIEGVCHDVRELQTIETLTVKYPRLIIIMFSTQQGADFLMAAMRAGIREVLPLPIQEAAIEAALTRAESKLELRNTQRSAKILAFIASKGGCGATFVAANLAWHLAEAGKKVLLLDLNLQHGEAVITIHDGKVNSDIAEVVNNIARLDAAYLSASTVRISPNFEILAAPEDPEHSLGIKAEHVEAILNVAMNHYDFIVMDLNQHLDELTIKALDHAHTIYLVMQALLPYVRNAHRMVGMFRSLGYAQDKIELLVNRYWKGGEITLDDLRNNVGISKMTVIPNDYKDVARAINHGAPLAVESKSCSVNKALLEFATTLAPKTESGNAGGLFGWLRKG